MSSSPCFLKTHQRLQMRRKQDLAVNAKRLLERPSARKLEDPAVNAAAEAEATTDSVEVAEAVVDMDMDHTDTDTEWAVAWAVAS